MIFLVGPLPPPLHGASLITGRVADAVAAAGLDCRVLSTGPGKGASGASHHLRRIAAYARAAAAVLRGQGGGTVYLSLSGGLGLVYDLAVTVAARLRRRHVTFHHHSFAYLNRPTPVLRLIIAVAGLRQTHIVLCRAMSAALSRAYPLSRDVQVVSNIAFMDVPIAPAARRHNLLTIGYLANISLEKGIDRFLDLVAHLRMLECPVEASIAGPVDDPAVADLMRQRMNQIGDIRHIGPVFGASKEAFLQSVDLLVFPTRYVNEAQPLVVFEAQAQGIPVAASNRGCLADMIDAGSGLLLDADGSDVDRLAALIAGWVANPADFDTVRRNAEERVQELGRICDADRRHFVGLFQVTSAVSDLANHPG